MKKYDYIVRDLDILDDDTNNLKNSLQEYGKAGFKLLINERYVVFEKGQQKTYFRCIFIKEYCKDLDKNEDGYDELFDD